MNIQGVIPAPPFALIEFSGVERNDFLQRLLSNEMLLKPGQATAAYYLNVQGRPLAQFWVFQWYESTWLVCPKHQVETALQELDKMHFGEKLRMHDRTRDWQSTLLVGPEREAWLEQRLGQAPVAGPWGFQAEADWMLCRFPFLASGSDLVWSKRPLFDDLRDVSSQWDAERIQAARAWPSDWGEKTMLLEIADNTDYVDGKGCYPGQEVVARTLHRGHINRHIGVVGGSGSLPAPGLKLKSEDKDIGWISSVAGDAEGFAALAFLRREFWEPGTELVREDGGTVTVRAARREG
ncbi:MAG: hypothetical protein J0I12_15515 [Candidatus Eremiobacteraeota bacterium]|nr:hypothetical protein [Candidatus Eremiobacteraeota bacterium]